MTEEKITTDCAQCGTINLPHFEITDNKANYIYTLSSIHREKVAVLYNAGNFDDVLKYANDNCISKRRTDTYYRILAESLEKDVEALAKASIHNNKKIDFINCILLSAGIGFIAFMLIDILFK